ncbi:MAG: outer membrane beta-barrel protein, partial [Azospirillaceae bacterium]
MWGRAIGVARRSAIPGALAASLLAGTSAGTLGQDLFEVDPGNEARGWYLGVAGGGNFVEDLDLRINDTLTGGLDVNEGWAVLGSAGYGFESGFRVELETGYRSNDIGELDNADGTTSATRGSLDTVTIMGNVLLDLRNPTRFTPYIGIGVGAANTAMELFDAGGTLLVDDDSWNFAFQGIVGVALAITNNLSLTLDYRYTQATDLSWTGVDGVTAYEADETRNHAVMAGLSYTFAPPPA